MPKLIKREVEETTQEATTPKHCKVQCPSCGGVFFETTDKFDITRVVSPNMIRLIDIYADWGWVEVIPDNSAGFGALMCPECDSLIAPEGKLTLMCGGEV
jgi:hypothetical protein